MLVIRLFRVGKKNQPSFKIVVTDKRKPPRAGRFVEEVGFYNPLTKEKVLKGERIKYWLSVGAKPSNTVHNLFVSEKIMDGKKTPVHKKAKEKKETVPEKPVKEKPVEEKPKEPSSAKATEGEESKLSSSPFAAAREGKEKPKEEAPKKEKKEETPKEEKKEELPKTE
ncbi:MAG: 30S ribosomal protein S16 [Candidatus Pacebacteria bacterium]|nr:30S ribosomal protein S16 [Candidatus Paceibacterota bacterium]